MKPITSIQDIYDILRHVTGLLDQLEKEQPTHKFEQAVNLTASELNSEVETILDFLEIPYQS
ncbi:hypothetical protein LCGC14_2181170 [marine sediment metagenome]|uniref:Uncharacterized protein n=1 Tax=marine sediment metagenome TaxID=412755 RepID=A0A0F9GI58_9ZZZZ